MRYESGAKSLINISITTNAQNNSALYKYMVGVGEIFMVEANSDDDPNIMVSTDVDMDNIKYIRISKNFG